MRFLSVCSPRKIYVDELDKIQNILKKDTNPSIDHIVIQPLQKAYNQTYFLQNDNYDLVSRHYGGSLDIVDKMGNFVKNIYYRDESLKDSYCVDYTLALVKNTLQYSNSNGIVWQSQFPQDENIQIDRLLDRLL